MNGSVREFLSNAAENRKSVSVVYHGGSQPGVARDIIPLVVTDLEVRARDIATDETKISKLEKLEICDSQTAAPAYDPNFTPPPDCSIEEAFRGRVAELEALGWHVELLSDMISLHRYFKNGKPRKGCDVSMRYDKYCTDLYVELDGTEHAEKRESARPYCVSSKRLAASRTFGHMANALLLFWEEVRALAPASGGGQVSRQ